MVMDFTTRHAGAGVRKSVIPEAGRQPRGLFVGLTTLDLLYGLPRLPGPNEKMTADRQVVAAGGPAANAAVTFASLGGRADLVTALGAHTLAQVSGADLAAHGVTVHDVTPGHDGPPTVSSILSTGADRAVVSVNDAGLPPPGPLAADRIAELLDGVSVVLSDGRHTALAIPLATAARERGIPVLLDAGSWKPAAEPLLDLATVVVCSADFRVPGAEETLPYLLDRGARWAAVSAGGGPVRWLSGDSAGEVEVPQVDVVDTLGAGDILHGALAFGMATRPGAVPAELLEHAVHTASRSCRHFGTRAWLTPEVR
jgi:sugar/nucleoside kinase (ribokinase family)